MHYLIWIIVAAVYSPILRQLYGSRWENIDYTHAYFILPVSLWLAWRKRKELFALAAANKNITKADTLGLASFILGILLLVFGWRQDYLLISSFSLIPALFGLTRFLYGKPFAKALTFPLLYLLLMIPPPLGVLDSVTVPMRYGVSIGVTEILQLLKYPIQRDGLLIFIGGHEIYMGAPCSGFRSLITMISLSIVYVYVLKAAAKTKAILIASIVPLALLGNLIRVLCVCLATFHFGEDLGVKVHDYGGFVIFLVLILGLIGLETLLNKNVKT